jgi:serine/threonine protein kinase
MNVIVFACGPAANESELKATEHIRTRLQTQPGDDRWIILANLAFSVTNQLQSDEVDLVVIGPPGARVIEIKHWTHQWVESNREAVEHEADRVTNKAKKIGTTLRRAFPDLPRVDGVFLSTQEASKVKRLSGLEVRGVRFYSLQEWQGALNMTAPQVLAPNDIARLGRILEPKSAVAIDGSLRRLAGYVNLELQTPKNERFHRVYRGSHPSRRDRVVLHLYDLSGSDDKNAEVRAKREFEALHRLQTYAWAPRILDSYQDVPGYAGEMFFFTLVDPAAPSIDERGKDSKWTGTDRVALARRAIAALRQLHAPVTGGEPILHRNLTPNTILVRHDNTPILTGFQRSKIPSELSVASSGLPEGAEQEMLAPEVRAQGFAVADYRSDIYSICAALKRTVDGVPDPICQRAGAILDRGMATQQTDRPTLEQLEFGLAELLGESIPLPPPPAARFWTEDQVVRFRDRDYRILSRLGSGGVGTAFKVVEVDRHTQEDVGTYVAKVAHDGATGAQVLRAYSLVRSHLRHTGLSTIFEVARDWQENQFIALMTWVSGAPLGDFIGVFSLLADDQQDPSAEALALRWLRVTCQALDVLHRNGLVHGDVSPRNLIVSGSDIVLTDYDFVTKIGERPNSPGTVLYCSPSYHDGRAASPSDDIYALAASFFHVVYEREPFVYGHELDKRLGINWDGLNRGDGVTLTAFLDRATAPSESTRFTSVADALDALEPRPRISKQPDQPVQIIGTRTVPPSTETEQAPSAGAEFELREQRIPWLLSLLQSYPGSRWGNRETRGLDTDFASQTYVDTSLEETLFHDIRQRRVRLVILCGNAGDGKTALLQHLAARLGLGRHQSSERILEARLEDGLLLRMNLDGSASWQGRSADELLDEFLAPFHAGAPVDDIVHLLAINDGRLLEWIEGVESRNRGGETPLTSALYTLLQQEAALQESHIRFISLNRRSLVGGINVDRTKIDTDFLERLLDHLYGGDQANSLWTPCQTCSAQDRCEVFRATRLFGPEAAAVGLSREPRVRARQRLFEALQAVHLRGETHITVRELRAALVYILFGTHYCDDYHSDRAGEVSPYWDRTFWVDSFARQGEVLSELARFDPGLEAHPQIDRYVITRPAADAALTPQRYPDLTIESGRRRAFFEWSRSDVERVAGDADALDLARGQHLRLFSALPLHSDDAWRNEVCRRLCAGISRLEDLPPQALDRRDVVPLRVTPRTPTETAFWVEKPLASFRVEADLPIETEGIERLHRHAHLIYRYRTGAEERLRLGADLFHLLLELADGYQLGDVSTDDTFAHLSIFVQRLVREDERELLAWNPMQDETLYRVAATIDNDTGGPKQRLVITSVAGWGDGQ